MKHKTITKTSTFQEPFISVQLSLTKTCKFEVPS